jgi:hypothetical protein
MKRAIAVAIALACVACGESTDVAPDPGAPRASAPPKSGAANEAPTIDAVELGPNPAGSADPITLDLKARDAERDRLTTSVDWYKNGVLVPDLHGTVVDAGTFSRGDTVYAIATVSDATHEVTAQSAALTIGNSAPKVRSVVISSAKVTAADMVEAQANAEDADGDSFELSYQWYRNGEPIPSATSSRLAPGIAHRGDKVSVSASATDGSDAGPWLQSAPVTVANADPVITTQPSYEMTPNGEYQYSVGAKDADNDTPLKFELVEGPKGMTVDEQSGVVTWAVPDDAKGNSPIKVTVTDAYGGRATQAWVLSVDWNESPASASDKQKKAPRAKDTTANQASGDSPDSDDMSGGEATPSAKKAPAAKPAGRVTEKKAPHEGDEPEEDQGAAYDEEKF